VEEFIQRALGAGGHLSKLVKGYSPRPPQMLISNKVGAALEDEKHLLAEAGTGTGKSLGYLIPAAKWAVENNKTVIVCTHTIPLMTQIVNVELPRVQQILKMEHQNLKYQLVKGKSHYVCYSKLENLWQETLRSMTEESKTVQKIFKRVTREHVNDRTGLGFDVEDSLWNKISASTCPAINKPESCLLEELKEKMHKSHIIVTNHAYFFSDLAIRRKTGNGSLPNYDAVIFDEAHEMEDVCCQIFEKSADVNRFESLFEHLFRRDFFTELDHRTQLVFSQIRQDIQLKLDQVYTEVGNGMQNKAYQLLHEKIDVADVCSLIKEFIDKLKSLNVKGSSDILDKLFECNDDLDFISSNSKRSWAYWATVRGRDHITLHAAPLFPKVILASSLFEKVPVILTSATMSNGGKFSFFAGRVGVKEYDSVVVSSPFDYLNKTMIIVPDDAPDPNSLEFNRYTADKLEEITMYTGGRMLVLFTSFEAMNQVARYFQNYCSEVGYHLLVQYPGCNREELIQHLKNEPRTIVFGSSSFWTGVDVAGDALTAVVIPRLPFPHPDDPLIKAQIELLEKADRSSFFDYMFPKMIFKLKQGFGRLNRSVYCQGAVIILDNRMRTKRYKGLIIKSLPKCQYSSTVSDLVHILPI
jgi:Rad3-related DNA helicase